MASNQGVNSERLTLFAFLILSIDLVVRTFVQPLFPKLLLPNLSIDNLSRILYLIAVLHHIWLVFLWSFLLVSLWRNFQFQSNKNFTK